MKRVQSTLSVAMWLLVSVMICGSAAVFTSCGENTLEEILGAIDNPSGSTVAVTGITLNKASLRLYMNNTETMPGSVLLTAAVYPDNATDQSVTWSSSDETKATVDKTGKVTAVATGTATITAKAGDKTVTCEVYVYTKKHNINTEGDAVVPAGEFWLIEGTGESVAKSITIGDGAMITLNGINITKNIACEGDATIILADGSENTVSESTTDHAAGIAVGPTDKTLTIKGEPAGTGKLNAQGDYACAGIGSKVNASCGNIVVEGGDITAKGGFEAAGIGTGVAHNFEDPITIQCGDITIRGGKVEATGGVDAAGIGTGYNIGYGISHNICGAISISGGVVKASSASSGAGIGCGYQGNCGDIEIRGDDTKVTAVGGNGYAGIGSGSKDGSYGSTSSCGTITIYGGTVEATGGTNGAGIGSGREGECGKITISGGVVKASSASNGAGIGCGLIGVCGDIEISGDDTKVTAVGGLGGAGIGSGQSEYPKDSRCGHITILGGTVDAKGGDEGAGIGTGYAPSPSSSCGDINITSGVTSVTATKGSAYAESIGRGYSGDCGTVTIEDEEKVTQN